MTDHSTTKYILLIGDGMADYPLKELGGKTPLEVADTPHMDRIAASRVGLVKTIPEGMEPGSDVANLSLLGYDPGKYYTGRAPLEAASMGVTLGAHHVAFRMNLVTLDLRSDDEIIMVSHSAGDISTGEAVQVVGNLKEEFDLLGIEVYQGVAYRHLVLWEDGPESAMTIPPHDVLGRNMGPYLNYSTDKTIPQLIRRSWSILKEHPINVERRRAGLKEANSIWLWGQGRAPELPLFEDKYGLKGGVVSAVDLVKGIGVYAGFMPIHVEGATGYLNTNYQGKTAGALKGLKRLDFIFLHVEAPDEAGHNGNYQEKIEAIENFDQKVVGPVLDGLKDFEGYRIMVVSDHLTPIAKRTHTSDPTPFAWASKEELEGMPKGSTFTEGAAGDSGLMFDVGHELIDSFLFQD